MSDDDAEDRITASSDPGLWLLLLQQFKAACARADERNWANDATVVDQAAAIDKAKETLKSQLANRELFDEPRATIFRGMLAIEDVFDPLPPCEETLEIAVQDGLDDPATFLALQTLSSVGFADQSPALRKFRRDLLAGLIEAPPKKRGPSPYRNVHRDMIVATQVQQLAKAGISPTRNAANYSAVSGCDIVADALNELGESISYSAVERIWSNRQKRPEPRFFAELMTQVFMSASNDGDTS